MPQIPFELLAAALTLAGAAIAAEFFPQVLQRLYKKRESPQEGYGERLARLTASLTRASSEVDEVLRELARVAADREDAVKKLEIGLRDLEGREKQIQQRIQDLQNVSLPVAEHFAKLIAAGEKRSAWRDYILFGAGVIASTAIAIILRLIGWG